MKRLDILSAVFLFIVSWILVSDLFFHPGRSITFDGHIHITTIAQFYNALADGEFPVRWADGFANYGFPLPLIAHQIPAYIGAFFQIFTHNPVTAYNLTMFVGVFLSCLFLYTFFRYYAEPLYALVGAVIFNFAPYRIVNIYARGALPEVLATAFIPVILIGLHALVIQKKKWGYACIIVGSSLLALTHPMMLILGSIVIVPYSLAILWPLKKNLIQLGLSILAACVGLLISSYYLLPLSLENKYLTYGQFEQRFSETNTFVTAKQLLLEQWNYFSLTHPGPRPQLFSIGSIELLIIFTVAVVVGYQYKKNKHVNQLIPWAVTAVISLFFLFPISKPLYTSISILGSIQFAWRMLAPLAFVPAFATVWLLQNTRYRWLPLCILLAIGIIRFPQLYGKNYMVYDTQYYDHTIVNLHTTNMNTIWMGDSREYPVKDTKIAVISGQADVQSVNVQNSKREYRINAQTESRLVDYTFYFPGWNVYVDNQPTEIQFQDPAYRGIITYSVPPGEHTVTVMYEYTKIRLLALLMTIAGILFAILSILGLRYIDKMRIPKKITSIFSELQ